MEELFFDFFFAIVCFIVVEFSSIIDDSVFALVFIIVIIVDFWSSRGY